MSSQSKPETEDSVFVGMHRPDWDVFAGRITASIMCSCGALLTHQGATREHWQLGHFDKSVYVSAAEAYRLRLSEEGGRRIVLAYKHNGDVILARLVDVS